MKKVIICLFVLITTASFTLSAKGKPLSSEKVYEANNPYLQYTGRIDFSNPLKPRFWSPGVYIKAKFKGTGCEVVINDEELYGKSHNFIEIVIDDQQPYRIQTTGKVNTIKIGGNLSNKAHTVTICKDTESGIGYLEFVSIKCQQLFPAPASPAHKIEFIGNSITCGTGMDLSVAPCNVGDWYLQHNAYLSYGARTARNLNAQWHLTSVSGIGLIHSCCGMTVTMPQVFDKLNLRTDTIPWDFKRYQPDVVTVCLGQNDGVQDSSLFCKAYIKFISDVRKHYPLANIICLTSPMGDNNLTPVLKRYIDGIINAVKQQGDKKVTRYFFSKQYHKGCGGHPDMDEHKQIAGELTAYIRQITGWR